MTSAKLAIDIVSDVVCPWCYIGKNRVAKAMALFREQHPGAEFSIRWLPFYLNPNMSRMPKQDYYYMKFGEERTKSMTENMTKLMHQEGLPFKFGGMAGPTRDAHRLIALAGEQSGLDVQNGIVDDLFHAYFALNSDITDTGLLSELGVQRGLFASVSEGSDFFKSASLAAETDAQAASAAQNGVSGVPFIVIRADGGRQGYAVSGAQEPGTLVSIMEKALSG